MSKIKAIVFDLGGVIIDIDFNATKREFEKLGVGNFDEIFTQFTANNFAKDFETGKINPQQFFDAVQSFSNVNASALQLTNAWNAMIGNFRKESVEYCIELKNKGYKTFVLSNTNEVHQLYFEELFKQNFPHLIWNNVFTEIFYSHKINLRKPDKVCFEFVQENTFIENPNEILFIDDSYTNIDTPSAMGWQTHLLKAHERIENVLDNYLK